MEFKLEPGERKRPVSDCLMPKIESSLFEQIDGPKTVH